MNEIKINLKNGDLIEINADRVLVREVNQNITGGQLKYHTTEELLQLGNKIKVTEGGKIVNNVISGKLTQTDNIMEIDEESVISNKIHDNE